MTSTNTIKVGDRVRSFDFPDPLHPGSGRDLEGPRACFVEGTVVAVLDGESGAPFTCPTLKIRVERDMWGGEDQGRGGRVGDYVFPPVNGIPTLGGFLTDYVTKLEGGV